MLQLDNSSQDDGFMPSPRFMTQDQTGESLAFKPKSRAETGESFEDTISYLRTEFQPLTTFGQNWSPPQASKKSVSEASKTSHSTTKSNEPDSSLIMNNASSGKVLREDFVMNNLQISPKRNQQDKNLLIKKTDPLKVKLTTCIDVQNSNYGFSVHTPNPISKSRVVQPHRTLSVDIADISLNKTAYFKQLHPQSSEKSSQQQKHSQIGQLSPIDQSSNANKSQNNYSSQFHHQQLPLQEIFSQQQKQQGSNYDGATIEFESENQSQFTQGVNKSIQQQKFLQSPKKESASLATSTLLSQFQLKISQSSNSSSKSSKSPLILSPPQQQQEPIAQVPMLTEGQTQVKKQFAKLQHRNRTEDLPDIKSSPQRTHQLQRWMSRIQQKEDHLSPFPSVFIPSGYEFISGGANSSNNENIPFPSLSESLRKIGTASSERLLENGSISSRQNVKHVYSVLSPLNSVPIESLSKSNYLYSSTECTPKAKSSIRKQYISHQNQKVQSQQWSNGISRNSFSSVDQKSVMKISPSIYSNEYVLNATPKRIMHEEFKICSPKTPVSASRTSNRPLMRLLETDITPKVRLPRLSGNQASKKEQHTELSIRIGEELCDDLGGRRVSNSVIGTAQEIDLNEQKTSNYRNRAQSTSEQSKVSDSERIRCGNLHEDSIYGTPEGQSHRKSDFPREIFTPNVQIMRRKLLLPQRS